MNRKREEEDLAARGAQDTPKTIEEREAEAQRWGYACDCGRSGPITCGPMTSLSPGRVLAGHPEFDHHGQIALGL